MIPVVAIDDEPLALEVITNHCRRVPYLQLVATFTDVHPARAALQAAPPRLLFLDIEMPGQNGIAFYKSLTHQPPLILTTAYSSFAVEGFDIGAVDYLTKPIAFPRFLRGVEKVREALSAAQERERKTLLLRDSSREHKVFLDEILYAEALDNYVRLYRAFDPPLLLRTSLGQLLERLPALLFMRVHRSFVVRLGAISGVEAKKLCIAQVEIPVSASYSDALLAYWTGSRL